MTAKISREKRNVIVLAAAQAYLGAQMSMLFIVGGLAGQMLSPNPCFATLPISLIVFGSMLAAQPLSGLMQRRGRRAGFVLGAICGGGGALLGAFGLYSGSFAIFLAGSLLAGGYMSSLGFYRFAAADTASETFRPKAISYVMAGGLASAIIGPQLVKLTSDLTVIPFLGTYLAVVVLNLTGVALFLGLDIPRPPAPAAGSDAGRSRAQLLASPVILVAIICAMVTYALMNLVMTSTPLAVVGCGFAPDDAADIVSAHVLAMYAPSFFTGHVIARFGVRMVTSLGLVFLAIAGLVGLAGVEITNFYGALILLGLGWNFAFIGATTMLSTAHTPEERGRVQGMNDFAVFGCVTLASLASGTLMNCAGGSPQEGWSAVNMAMLPFLALAGGALIWLRLRGDEPTRL
ncbi:MFS transporter [Palleronia caenipelagi]|uniref:MFS transporter n=2 Tax=Palleronia caenipelagi TaxID=2489174 RepID=A0A547Q588_9RHOB|nr:MFS transporter [Palleronia caenipelagi]